MIEVLEICTSRSSLKVLTELLVILAINCLPKAGLPTSKGPRNGVGAAAKAGSVTGVVTACLGVAEDSTTAEKAAGHTWGRGAEQQNVTKIMIG